MSDPQSKPTARINTEALLSPQERLRQVISDIARLEELLRADHAALRPRAVTLPAETLYRVQATHTHLDNLAYDLLNRQIELRQLRALAETTALINSTLEPNIVLNQVIDTVIQLTGAERGYIMLLNKATGALEFRVARGIDQGQLSEEDFTVSETIINEVFTTGQPVLTDNARNDPRYQSMESVVGYQLRSILAVPLIVRGETIGAVYCDNRALSSVFKESELDLLTAFANQAAVALENARLFEAARAQLAAIREMRDLVDSVFTSVISGLITLNGRDAITAFNRAAEEITFMTAESVIGAPLFAVLPMLHDPLDEALAEIRAGAPQTVVEFALVLPHHGRRIWRVNASPLRGSDGSGGGVVLVLDDLTEQREREAKLDEARRYVPLALVENLGSADIAALGGQSREISVVFADVRGFTSFSEKLEPEVLMRIINNYLSAASDAIDSWEGVIDKYVGDAVSALFNTPLNPQPDHAVRAVSAALAVHRAVQALHQHLPPSEHLEFRIGVHTGMAVLGNIGSPERREFTAIGDAVDMAKLLQDNAEAGEVMISAATAEQVRAACHLDPLTPTRTASRSDFTVIYRVRGMR
jgi:PAS domain S-box-containing protein